MPIFDMHADVLMHIARAREAADESSIVEAFNRHVRRMRAGGVVGAVVVDCRMAGESASSADFERFVQIANVLMHCNSASFCIATSADQLEEALGSTKWVGLICHEGLRAADGDLAWIERLYSEAGMRIASLTHNDSNAFATGAGDPAGSRGAANPRGLSRVGRQAVALMNELGVLIDLAHASPATRRDILSCSSRPVMLSHTSSAAIYDNGRNLSDEDMREIADRGGLLGCMTSPAALADISDRHHHTLERYVEHLRHMIDAAGEDHVGLGLHFCEYLYTPQEYPPVAGLEDASKAMRIVHALRGARLTERQIEKVAFRNFFRVFREATH